MVMRFSDMIRRAAQPSAAALNNGTIPGGLAYVLDQAMQGWEEGKDRRYRKDAMKAVASALGGDMGGSVPGAIPGAAPGAGKGFELPSKALSRSVLQPGMQASVQPGTPSFGGQASPSLFPASHTLADTGGATDPIYEAIIKRESAGNPRAVSSAGARGLMQLMPDTAKEVAGELGLPYSPEMLDDPEYNRKLGTAYYDKMLKQFGSHTVALAAYNAGPGNVQKWLKAYGDPRSGAISEAEFAAKIPFAETRNYVTNITNDLGGDFTGTPAQSMQRPGAFASPLFGRGSMPLGGEGAGMADKDASVRQLRGEVAYAGGMPTAAAIGAQNASFGGGGQAPATGGAQFQRLVEMAEAGNPYAFDALQMLVAMRQQQEEGAYGRQMDQQRFAMEQQRHQLAMSQAGQAPQESFGAPQQVMGPDGQPQLVQFGNRGTVRPVSGYGAVPEAGVSDEISLAGTGFDAASINAYSELEAKRQQGIPLTPAEANRHRQLEWKLQQPTEVRNPDGSVTRTPGMSLEVLRGGVAQGGAVQGAPVGGGMPAQGGVQRQEMADGTTVETYADGRTVTTYPDGKQVERPAVAADVRQFNEAKQSAFTEAYSRAQSRLQSGAVSGGLVGGVMSLLPGEQRAQQQDYKILEQQVVDRIMKTFPGVQTEGDALRAAQQLGILSAWDPIDRQQTVLRNYERFLATGQGIDPSTVGGQPGGTGAGGFPVVRSDAEYDALPSKAEFTDETGTRYRKP